MSDLALYVVIAGLLVIDVALLTYCVKLSTRIRDVYIAYRRHLDEEEDDYR